MEWNPLMSFKALAYEACIVMIDLGETWWTLSFLLIPIDQRLTASLSFKFHSPPWTSSGFWGHVSALIKASWPHCDPLIHRHSKHARASAASGLVGLQPRTNRTDVIQVATHSVSSALIISVYLRETPAISPFLRCGPKRSGSLLLATSLSVEFFFLFFSSVSWAAEWQCSSGGECE